MSSAMFRQVFVVCACALWVASANDIKEGEKTTLKAVALSNHIFTSSLYRQLSTDEGNLFFSPMSVQMILALAAMGAEGSTALQMKTGLSLPADDAVTKDGFHKLTASLKRSDSNMILKIANKIFTDDKFEIKPAFLEMAQTKFNADAGKVDFMQDSEGARQKINRWVEEQTEHKIKDLFAEGALTTDTRMVLTNAVYFKSQWALPFNASMTTTEPFHVTETETKDVSMMHVRGEFFYKNSREIDAQILELPYIGHKMSMVIILPNKQNGLAEVERKLAEVPLTSVTKHLRLPEVIVSMPKFKLEKALELNGILKKMGMTDMFSSSANFSGITDSEVYVDKVAHKAFIEVNEEGSEAAGASGVTFQARMGGRSYEPLTFRADHPFIFLLRHKYKSNPVLFMGRYSEP